MVIRRISKEGFTLIELLVVIAIIGLLASVVLASLNTARKKSRDARRLSDVKQIQNALELYFEARIGNDGTGAEVGVSYPLLLSSLAPTYIPVEPKDPTGQVSYPYVALDVSAASPTQCTLVEKCLYYHIGANLEEDGTGANGTGGNPALAADRDLATNLVGGFGGLSVACSGANTADDGCYDLTP